MPEIKMDISPATEQMTKLDIANRLLGEVIVALENSSSIDSLDIRNNTVIAQEHVEIAMCAVVRRETT